MPVPGTPDAPVFKGKHVNDFLDSLKMLADQALVDYGDLPAYVIAIDVSATSLNSPHTGLIKTGLPPVPT